MEELLKEAAKTLRFKRNVELFGIVLTIICGFALVGFFLYIESFFRVATAW